MRSHLQCGFELGDSVEKVDDHPDRGVVDGRARLAAAGSGPGGEPPGEESQSASGASWLASSKTQRDQPAHQLRMEPGGLANDSVLGHRAAPAPERPSSARASGSNERRFGQLLEQSALVVVATNAGP